MSSHSWSGGYVADIPYTAGYHPSQSPTLIGLTCAVCDVAWTPPDRDALTVLELGCGRGITACALAAANPGWRVVAVDYNPAHIAEAREFAAEAGLGNVTFLEMDLARLDAAEAARRLPQADVITLHGVWTWVSDEVRAGILAVLHGCLAIGGLAMVSYNAMPGWAQGLAAQRLIRAAATQRAGSSLDRAEAGIEALKAFHGAEAAQLQNSVTVERLLQGGIATNTAYVAHEYLTDHWRPAWAADVIRDLAAAKLDFVGSASIEDNFQALVLTEKQREAVGLIHGPERETAIDICLRRTFRTDVFIRGRRRTSGTQRLHELRLGLVVVRDRIKPVVRTALGDAALPPHVAEPVLAALAEGPRTVGELLALPGAEKATAGEIVAVLVGGGWAVPLWRDPPPFDSEAAKLARRHNATALRRYGAEQVRAGGRLGLAVPAAASGFPCPADELAAVVMLQSAAEAGEPPPDLDTVLSRLLHPEASDEGRNNLRERLTGRIPAWRALGAA